MSEFKIGDRVRIVSVTPIDEADGVKIVDGMTGTVKEVDETEVGVEFDDDVNGHDGFWEGKDGHCWYVEPKYLEKIGETKEEAEEMKEETVKQKILEVLRKEIGVAVGEEFDVYENGEKQWTCKFEEIGFLDEINGKFRESGVWKQIVCRFHRYQFKRKPFIPRLWQEYFYLDIEDLGDESLSVDIEVAAWIGEIGDYGMLAFGNVFRTEEEALRNRDKVLERLKKLRKGEQI